MLKILRATALAAAVAAAGMSQAVAGYMFHDLAPLGGSYSVAVDINRTGQVVGYSATPNDADQHATVWTGQSRVDLGVAGGTDSGATAINNSGQIVGWAFVPGGGGFSSTWGVLWQGSSAIAIPSPWRSSSMLRNSVSDINDLGEIVGVSMFTDSSQYHATRWVGLQPIDLGTLGGSMSFATGINSSGDVVGYSSMAGELLTRGTLWSGSVVTELGTLGGSNSMAYSINDSRIAVGISSIQGDQSYHATMWAGNNFVDLGTLGGSSGTATDINNLDQIVGYSNTLGDLSSHATLWDHGQIIDLNYFIDESLASAGWYLSQATAISDNGWIAGQAYNPLTGATRAFLLETTSEAPEPPAIALLFIAFLGLVMFGRHRA